MNCRAMTKLADLLQFRNQLSQKKCFGKDVRDALLLHCFTSRAGISTARQTFAADGKLMSRTFAPYSVYKGKAAFSASPRLPTFNKMDSGCLKRQRFALSATEVGSFISLGPRDSCEFFHDPAMLSSNAGQVRKSLSIKPHADGSGYFISLSVVNNILKTNDRFTVPVTTAEFAVMRTAFSFALPHIMGWDRLTNQLPKNKDENPLKVDPQVLDLEWDR
ncbi:hypothetical protein F0562_022594 [Nyssa sinensis]|uniref:Uncharacterized protein n=1 Tax=Nyssa sinensis TaxID=561372 RepID=A0A5J5BS26_9ASTE|nr:hypothetical protein F0562_022594 [Nyssa sinensis]